MKSPNQVDYSHTSTLQHEIEKSGDQQNEAEYQNAESDGDLIRRRGLRSPVVELPGAAADTERYVIRNDAVPRAIAAGLPELSHPRIIGRRYTMRVGIPSSGEGYDWE